MLTLRSSPVASMLVVLIAASIAAAPSNLLADDPAQKVIDFCERALLRDRGVANTDFAGKSDDWLMLHLVLNKKLRKQIDVTPSQLQKLTSETDDYFTTACKLKMSEKEINELKEQIEQAGDSSTAERKVSNKQTSVAADASNSSQHSPDSGSPLQSWNPRTQHALEMHLESAQLDQLDLLYLNLEGLAALARPHLAKRLALSDEQRRKIVNEVNACRDNESLPLHRALFTLNEGNAATEGSIQRELRRVSMRLDKNIHKHLDQNQIAVLAKMTDNAKEWEPLIINPGIGQVTATEIEKAGQAEEGFKDKST